MVRIDLTRLGHKEFHDIQLGNNAKTTLKG